MSSSFLNWIKTGLDWWLALSLLFFAFSIMNIFQPLTQRVYFFSAVFLLFICLNISFTKRER
jgi:hypothetical protein